MPADRGDAERPEEDDQRRHEEQFFVPEGEGDQAGEEDQDDQIGGPELWCEHRRRAPTRGYLSGKRLGYPDPGASSILEREAAIQEGGRTFGGTGSRGD